MAHTWYRILIRNLLKNKYKLTGKKVLSTFGLLSSGKSIETTLDALPAIVKTNPDVLFLIIGKTHPSVVKQEGEKYRKMLEAKVEDIATAATCTIYQLFFTTARPAGIFTAHGYLFIHFQGSKPGSKRNIFLCYQLRLPCYLHSYSACTGSIAK